MTILSLWLPILLSAIGVFIVSSIIHMLIGYHSSNFKKLPDEDNFLQQVGKLEIPPGEYMYPYCSGTKAMQSKQYQQKLNDGPVGMMTAMPKGPFAMGKNLLNWFIYSLLVGVFSAYIAIHSLTADAEYLSVMRMVGTAAFGGYALALIQNSVWYSRSWKTTFKFIFDGLIYSLVTGGIFGWLWG
jgi:hypothetical protein